MSIFLAILALGFLIVVHEAGHFVVARWSGMRVERFSIGFGPAILKWKPKDTQFQIAPIPFGGFVQITGMNPHEEYDPADPHVYPNRPTWQRFLTILAGPGTNYISSIFLIFAVYAFAGVESWLTVGEVIEGSPATGVLQANDRIVAIEGHRIVLGDDDRGIAEFKRHVQGSQGKPVTVEVLRDGKPVSVQVTPVMTKAKAEGERDEYRLQIGLGTAREQIGLGQALYLSARYPLVKSKQILVDLYRIIKREVPGDVAGPIGITDVIRRQIQAGWVRAFEILALLSVYLGLFNLLPLPALDGGRLAFLGYELATRRRPNPRVEAVVHTVGFVALSLLMILVIFKDIKRLFVGG